MSFRMSPAFCFLALLALGCPQSDPDIKDDTAGAESVDADGDGFTTDEDCDDSDVADRKSTRLNSSHT